MQNELKNGKIVSVGYRIDRYDPRDYRYSATPRALPVSIDNRTEVVRIMNQNPEGACPGHAVCAAAEFLYWKKLGTKIDLSQRWAYRKARENDPWPGENYHGSTLRAAVKSWANFGICEEKFWPYKAYQMPEKDPGFDLISWEGQPLEGADENALQYPLQTYRRCYTSSPFELKHAIHEHGMVIVGGTVHSGWDMWGEATIKYDDSVYELGGHAFILVGYDEVEKFYWAVNSWGDQWGVKGFGKYSYGDAHENLRDAWTVTVPV